MLPIEPVLPSEIRALAKRAAQESTADGCFLAAILLGVAEAAECCELEQMSNLLTNHYRPDPVIVEDRERKRARAERN